ncbi:MAG TPA: hypothetical protein VFE47_19890 [Tepidisphaeraceae bacterium]|nr:hypothetical protein [Tepidisphaeraceae bacterium]
MTRRVVSAGEHRPKAASSRPMDDPHRARMIDAVSRQLLARNEEFRRLRPADLSRGSAPISDFVFAVEDEPHHAEYVFPHVRWGGQFVYLSFDRAKVDPLPAQFAACGFEPLQGPDFLRTGALRFIPYMGRKLWYFIARKLFLARPRDITERFTYNVQLTHPPAKMATSDSYVVLKEVPTLERVIARLRAKFTDVPNSVIEKRAMKFTNKVFPLFLTREAAILKILHRDLPEEYRCRVPSLLDLELDDRGYARRMWMNWLRIGGKPLSQLEFARQSADLLRAVHDTANIIHLDLRLDNFLITDNGVCFVDFGSSVRIGENIQGNPLLSTLFEELMRTSQIQRMLYKMTSSGTVTSKLISEAAGRVDKQVDLFYLAVQINQPLHNPDFAGLVNYDPKSREAVALSKLTEDILKPADPSHPRYQSAAQMLEGLKQIEADLAG